MKAFWIILGILIVGGGAAYLLWVRNKNRQAVGDMGSNCKSIPCSQQAARNCTNGTFNATWGDGVYSDPIAGANQNISPIPDSILPELSDCKCCAETDSNWL